MAELTASPIDLMNPGFQLRWGVEPFSDGIPGEKKPDACVCGDCLGCLQRAAWQAKDLYLMAYYNALPPDRQQVVLQLMDIAPTCICVESILEAVYFNKGELIARWLTGQFRLGGKAPCQPQILKGCTET